MTKQYIGRQKVSEYNDVEGGKVKYTLANGQGDTVLKEQFDSMVADHEYEDEMVRIQKWNPVVAEILTILLKYDLPMGEKTFVLDRADYSIIQNYGKAASKLMGAAHEDVITLSQIDKALKS